MSSAKALAKFGVAAVLLTGLSSCSVENHEREAVYTGGQPGVDRPVTLDDKLAEVAEQVPGFAGMFYDQAGNLNVRMTAPKGELGIQALEAREGKVKKAIVSVFGRGVLRSQVPGVGDPELHAQGGLAETKLLVLTAKYDFLTLRRWYHQLNNIFAISGVIFTDIDEMRNRLVIGVERGNAAARQQVEKELVGIGMPRGMVLIEEADPAYPTNTLKDNFSPKVGAIGIDYGTEGRVCTLGFNAFLNDTPGFVTNSHCTTTQGGVEGTAYSQGGVYVGKEVVDPLYDAVGDAEGTRCQALECRWSDSAFVAYDSTVQWSVGHLAKTTTPTILPDHTSFANTDIITVDPANLYMKIVGEIEPIAGQYFSKIGGSTGWTYSSELQAPDNYGASIGRSCSDERQGGHADGGPNKVFLCQFVVSAGVFGGDSGSPVFVWLPDGTVYLAGIVWGSIGSVDDPNPQNHVVGTHFLFSPMDQVRWELTGKGAGTLQTH